MVRRHVWLDALVAVMLVGAAVGGWFVVRILVEGDAPAPPPAATSPSMVNDEPLLAAPDEKTPMNRHELQGLAEGVALLIDGGDRTAASAMVALGDDQTGCDIQAFESFHEPGDFVNAEVRREARASAADFDWQVAFGIVGDTSLAVVQNCTEIPFP